MNLITVHLFILDFFLLCDIRESYKATLVPPVYEYKSIHGAFLVERLTLHSFRRTDRTHMPEKVGPFSHINVGVGEDDVINLMKLFLSAYTNNFLIAPSNYCFSFLDV